VDAYKDSGNVYSEMVRRSSKLLRDPLLRRFNVFLINQELGEGRRIKYLYMLRKLMRFHDLDHKDLEDITAWIRENYSSFSRRDYLLTLKYYYMFKGETDIVNYTYYWYQLSLGLVILNSKAKDLLIKARYTKIGLSGIEYLYNIVKELFHPELGIIRITEDALKIKWPEGERNREKDWIKEIISEKERLNNAYKSISRDVYKVINFNVKLKEYNATMCSLIRDLSYLVRDITILLKKIIEIKQIKHEFFKNKELRRKMVLLTTLVSDASLVASKLIVKYRIIAIIAILVIRRLELF